MSVLKEKTVKHLHAIALLGFALGANQEALAEAVNVTNSDVAGAVQPDEFAAAGRDRFQNDVEAGLDRRRATLGALDVAGSMAIVGRPGTKASAPPPASRPTDGGNPNRWAR